MAVSHISTTGSPRSASGATHTLTIPTAVQGDLMIACAMIYGDQICTPPAGWTEVGNKARVSSSNGTNVAATMYLFWTIRGASAPNNTFTWNVGGIKTAWIMVLRTDQANWPALPLTGATTWNAGTTPAPAGTVVTLRGMTMPSTGLLVSAALIASNTGAATFTPAAGMTERYDGTDTNLGSAAATMPAVPSETSDMTTTGSVSGQRVSLILGVYDNIAPSAPVPTFPVSNQIVDANFFTWQFVDVNTNDAQSAYRLNYRLVGAPSWTQTAKIVSTAMTHPIPALAPGMYEWYVTTWDSDDKVSPISAVSTFEVRAFEVNPNTSARVKSGGSMHVLRGTTWVEIVTPLPNDA